MKHTTKLLYFLFFTVLSKYNIAQTKNEQPIILILKNAYNPSVYITKNKIPYGIPLILPRSSNLDTFILYIRKPYDGFVLTWLANTFMINNLRFTDSVYCFTSDLYQPKKRTATKIPYNQLKYYVK